MRSHRPISTALAAAFALTMAAPYGAAQEGRSRRVETPAAAAQAPAKPPQKSAPTRPEEPVDVNDKLELGTDVVNVLFSVTDGHNRFVGDLKESDIVVAEGGEPQQVFSFRRETNLPLSVAVLVDVSSSQEYTFGDEKRAAAAFLQSVLRPKKDTAAIVSFREEVEYVQGMTARMPIVNEALNKMQWQTRGGGGSRAGATALYDALYITAQELFPKDTTVDDPASAVRRAMIVLTDGQDTASDHTVQNAIDEALRSDVIVYAIGIGDRYRSKAVKRDVLDVITEQTGGRAYFPQSYDDLSGAFDQIEQELRSQYLIAYEPSRVVRDGAFREIKISLPGRGELKVFHRKGYYAPKGDASPVTPSATVGRP